MSQWRKGGESARMEAVSLGKQEAGLRKGHPVWVVGEHLLSVAGPEWNWGTDQVLTIWTRRCSGCGWATGLLAAEAVGQGSVLSVVWPPSAVYAMSQGADDRATWGAAPGRSVVFIFRFMGGTPRGPTSNGDGPFQYSRVSPGGMETPGKTVTSSDQ